MITRSPILNSSACFWSNDSDEASTTISTAPSGLNQDKDEVKKPSTFRFKSADTVGAADAEHDSAFLSAAFVNNGNLDALADCQNPKCVILGRTGSGKTALIERLKETVARVVDIAPETLSMGYISNSTILRNLADLGVRLELFYKFLWRHVFFVELIKHRFDITDEHTKKTFLERFRDLFRSEKHKKALKYLEDWTGRFWEETEIRIQQIANKFCEEFKGSLSGKIRNIGADVEWKSSLTTEEREEVRQRGQAVANKLQIRQLNDMLDLLDTILDDKQKPYYVVVDRLDENWVEDSLRYKLIRALVETLRDFHKIKNAKIIIALRLDLLDRVVQQTRDEGFQEEKLETNYLRLAWDSDELTQVLDTRIDVLIRRHYEPQSAVTHRDILPSKIGSQRTVDYMIERTLMRPRDIILFFNECIRAGSGREKFTKHVIAQAEGEYSKSRWRSLADEWKTDYPNLLEVAKVLERRPSVFKFSSFISEATQNWVLGRAVDGFATDDYLSQLTRECANGDKPLEDYCVDLTRVFYKVGVVGLKIDSHESFVWGIQRRGVSSSEIACASIKVHPMFWRVLGIASG